jgi:hypothetical protein
MAVFEFDDSHVGLCRSAANGVLWFGISHAMIPVANPFANSAKGQR